MVRKSRTTFRTLVLAGCASLALCGAALAQDANKTIHFDIPAEDLGTALNQVAQQSQQEIVFNADLARGKRAPDLRGDFTPHQALERLLAGTGLVARTRSDGSIVVEAGDKQSALGLEEIVVTAEKRQEDVREISGSVTAYTGRQLEILGAQSLQDYLTMTPGVEFNGDIPGESRAVIRGVSTTTEFDQGQGTVGYFINDVPLTEPYSVVAIPDIDAFDVDNVTVLRGPQGTLFGSASLGGSINYQAAKPDLTEYQLHVQGTGEGVSGGGLGGSGKLMVNVPVVSDVFAIRAVYVYREDPGYIKNVGTGVENANTTWVRGGRIEATLQPTSSTTINYLFLDQSEDTADIGYQLPYSVGTLEKSTRFPEYANFTTLIHNLRLDQDLGFGVLTATATFHEKNQYADIDATTYFGPVLPGIDPIHLLTDAYSRGTTYEVRLASNPGGRFEYLVGAMHDSTNEWFDEYFQAANATKTVEADWSPVLGAGIGAAGAPNNVFYYALLPFHGQETAGFGEATYHFNNQWKVTLGGRLFETKSQDTSTYGGFFNILDGYGLTSYLAGSQKESGFTPKASITWTPNADFMAYALASEGFRFGGPNLNPSTPLYTIPPTFRSDSLWNYEAGIRSSWFDRRFIVDTSVFYIDWSNIQLLLATPTNLGYAVNAGRATNYGLEGTTTWRITHDLSLKTNLTYLQATLDSSYNPGSGQPIIPKGSELPGTAHWQVSNILSYDLEDLPGKPLFIVTQRYASDRAENFTGGTPLGSYSLFDARTSFRLPDNLTLSAFVDNVGNSHAISSASVGALGVTQYLFRPRTFGLTFDYKL
jgi:iron complex outermembrane receptor protein